ncbi:MAG: DUF1573 domain-containing protein [Planctomycetota bacterium]
MPRSSSVLAVALLLALSPARGDDPAPAPPAGPPPKLVVASKDLDFGEVMHGGKARLEVKLENKGAGPLLIKQVKPSCGCTVAKFPDQVAPGAVGLLELEFDSSERVPGYQSFRVAIYHNDPAQADQGAYCTLLNVRGEVKTLFRPMPQGAYFGEVIRGLGPAQRVVRVLGMGAAKGGFTLEVEGALPEYLKVQVKPWADERHRGQEVVVTLAPDAPLGSLQVPVELRTSLKEQPRLRIMVAALVNTRIMGPPSVHFGEVSRAGGEERLVVIERRDGLDGIPLVKARHDVAQVKVSWKSIGPRRLELALRLEPGLPPGPFATEVQLLFDDEHQRTLSVPIFAVVRPQVQVEPPVVLLPASAKAGEVVARLTVEGGVAGVAVEPASCGLSATLEGRAVSLTATGAALPRDEARLVLTTKVPGEERLVVPIVPR